jgi:hypothetical protein
MEWMAFAKKTSFDVAPRGKTLVAVAGHVGDYGPGKTEWVAIGYHTAGRAE